MTNEEAYKQLTVIWHGGMRDTMLCPDPWAERLYTDDDDDQPERPVRAMQRTHRDIVLQAVDVTRWRSRHVIAELTGADPMELSQDLFQLKAQGKIERRRTREGVYEFKRTSET